jgi:uncharacterized protein YbjT (DUF2867 family)
MENGKTIMVVGATGFLGTEICHQLITANKKVKALVRSSSDPSKVKALQELGIETITGDIKNYGSLQNAFANTDAVISTASSTFSRSEGDSIETVDRQGQLNVVEAADAAGVKQFIFISFLESPESFPLQNAKREVEKRLQNSKMEYTILRPTFFMDVWLSPNLGFDPANGTATIYGNGSNKISWIAIKDVAGFAVASLDNQTARNSIIDIGGPDPLSPLEVIELFEEQTDKKIQLQFMPEEAIRAQKDSSEDPFQQSFAALMLTYASGAIIPMKDILKIFPFELTSVKQFRNIHSGAEMAI